MREKINISALTGCICIIVAAASLLVTKESKSPIYNSIKGIQALSKIDDVGLEVAKNRLEGIKKFEKLYIEASSAKDLERAVEHAKLTFKQRIND